MAEYKVKSGGIGCYAKKLTKNVVDTIVFEERVPVVRVYSNGVAGIYFTTNGNAPTVGGEGTYEVPAATAALTIELAEGTGSSLTVKLISEGEPSYSVALGQKG